MKVHLANVAYIAKYSLIMIDQTYAESVKERMKERMKERTYTVDIDKNIIAAHYSSILNLEVN